MDRNGRFIHCQRHRNNQKATIRIKERIRIRKGQLRKQASRQ